MKLIQAIFYLIIFFLLYKVVKNLLFIKEDITPENEIKSEVSSEIKEIASDELIKDPYCGVFFPKNDGVPLKLKDKMYYFCSEECMRKFLDENN